MISRRQAFRLEPMALAMLLLLSGCDTMQQNQKAVAGGFLGALAAGGSCLLAHGNAALCAGLAVAGGGAGALIGHQFDERDKARRQQAMALALNSPALWSPRPGPAPATPVLAPDPEPAPAVADRTSPPEPVIAPIVVPAAAPVVAGGRNGRSETAWVDPDKQVAWVNPDTRNSGTITPLRSYVAPSGGRLCREMKETYVRQGSSPVSQDERACQNADGSWTLQNG